MLSDFINKPISPQMDLFATKVHNMDESRYFRRRLGFAAIAVGTVGTSAIDGVKGVAFAVLSLIKIGRDVELNKKAHGHLREFGLISPRLGWCTLGILNPNVDFDKIEPGVMITLTRKQMKRAAVSLSNRNFSDFTVMRITALISIPVAIVVRVADFALGLFAFIGVVFTFGAYKELNTFAIGHLMILQIITDVYVHCILILNPAAFPKEPSTK